MSALPEVRRRPPRDRAARAAILIACLVIGSPAFAQVTAAACGPIAGKSIVRDYRVERGEYLRSVENYHFMPSVEALVQGNGNALGDDLNYTLNRFPNHHRALIAMMRLGERLRVPQVPKAPYPVECYFERAVRFTPDDPLVRVIYAMYLFNQKRPAEVEQQMQVAIVLAKDNALTHYNIGLAYVDFGRNDLALKQAHRAMELGLTRTGLKERLQASGAWQELPALPGPDAAASRPG